jgi:hypothetical protein
VDTLEAIGGLEASELSKGWKKKQKLFYPMRFTLLETNEEHVCCSAHIAYVLADFETGSSILSKHMNHCCPFRHYSTRFPMKLCRRSLQGQFCRRESCRY